MAEHEIDNMSIKELKAVITSAGLSFTGCSEKAELRDRAREAQARLKAAKATKAPSPNSNRGVVAGWETRYEYWNGGGEGDVDIALILMHGIGASLDDLVPLAGALAPGIGSKCLFVFPGAPGSAWWPLDPAQWMMNAMGGEGSLAKLVRTEFDGLADCRTRGKSLVADVKQRSGNTAKIVLGGFSQGAMTSTDIALNLEPGEVDAIVHLSGAPIVVDQWAAALETRKPRVYISHGRADFVLPFAVSGWTKALFERAKVPLVYAPHDGEFLCLCAHALTRAAGGHQPGPLEPLVAFLRDTVSTST